MIACVRVRREYEGGGVPVQAFGPSFTGGVRGPGLILLIRVAQQDGKVDLRTIVHGTCRVRGSGSHATCSPSKWKAVLYFRVVDPDQEAVIRSKIPGAGDQPAAQTTAALRFRASTRSDEMLAEGADRLNADIQEILGPADRPGESTGGECRRIKQRSYPTKSWSRAIGQQGLSPRGAGPGAGPGHPWEGRNSRRAQEEAGEAAQGSWQSRPAPCSCAISAPARDSARRAGTQKTIVFHLPIGLPQITSPGHLGPSGGP